MGNTFEGRFLGRTFRSVTDEDEAEGQEGSS
jgi:hypothetical protein